MLQWKRLEGKSMKEKYKATCVRNAQVAMRGYNRSLALAWINKAGSIKEHSDTQERVGNYIEMMKYLRGQLK